MQENHRRRDNELQQHHAQRDSRRAHDDWRFFVATLAEGSSPGPRPKPLYLRAPDAKLPAAS